MVYRPLSRSSWATSNRVAAARLIPGTSRLLSTSHAAHTALSTGAPATSALREWALCCCAYAHNGPHAASSYSRAEGDPDFRRVVAGIEDGLIEGSALDLVLSPLRFPAELALHLTGPSFDPLWHRLGPLGCSEEGEIAVLVRLHASLQPLGGPAWAWLPHRRLLRLDAVRVLPPGDDEEMQLITFNDSVVLGERGGGKGGTIDVVGVWGIVSAVASCIGPDEGYAEEDALVGVRLREPPGRGVVFSFGAAEHRSGWIRCIDEAVRSAEGAMGDAYYPS